MKFPKDFQKTDFFNCGRPCRFWNGASGGLKELLTFNKCERFLLVHNGSFAISDLMLTRYPCTAVNCPWSPQFCGVLL